jgi:hypothetical protein
VTTTPTKGNTMTKKKATTTTTTTTTTTATTTATGKATGKATTTGKATGSGYVWPKQTPKRKAPTKAIRNAFSRDDLKRVCELREGDFPDAYGLTRVDLDRADTWRHSSDDDGDWYAYRDNGASVLAVAHLDTVVGHAARRCVFAETASGTVCHSGALDDRLGAYTILHLLPALGINVDILLTTGEESGMSTAEFFEANADKEYDWVIEFDRGGMDVVMYQYDDKETAELVRKSGARVGQGSFSDIAYLEHLEVKCFNWGTGYTGPGHNYHSARAHVWLDDYFLMVAYFLNFHADNAGVYLPHDARWARSGRRGSGHWGSASGSGHWWDDDDWNPDRDAFADVDVVDAVLVDADDDTLAQLADDYAAARMSGDDAALADVNARLDALTDAAGGDRLGEPDDADAA